MTPLPCDPDGQWPDSKFWLHAGWLIDGSGRAASRDTYIEVCDGIIRQVTSQFPDAPFDNLIDLGHATVIPMLMDAHVHLALSGTWDAGQRKGQLSFDPDHTGRAITRHLANHWRHGVSAVREAGDRDGSVWHYLGRRTTANRPPVSVALTRWAWHAPERYGTMIGRAPAPGVELCDAAADCFSNISHVKVIQSGINSIDRFGRQGPPQFTPQALSKLVQRAHEHQLKVMVHVNGDAAVRSAIEARCDSIEHGYFMGRGNLQRMADAGITWVPTIIPMVVLARSPQLTKSQRDIAKRTVDHQLEQLHLSREYGVKIGLGTDAGSPGVHHGAAVPEELALLISAGFSLEQAISSATAHNASLLGRHLCGALVPGMRADLLVVPNGPDRLVERLERIAAVCYHGQWQATSLLGI